MDTREMDEFLKKMNSETNPAAHQLTMMISDETIPLALVLQKLPKKSIITDALFSSVVILLLESVCDNSDEMLSMLEKVRTAVIKIETDFNKKK